LLLCPAGFVLCVSFCLHTSILKCTRVNGQCTMLIDDARFDRLFKEQVFRLVRVSGIPIFQCHFLLKAQVLSTHVNPEVHASAMQARVSATDTQAKHNKTTIPRTVQYLGSHPGYLRAAGTVVLTPGLPKPCDVVLPGSESRPPAAPTRMLIQRCQARGAPLQYETADRIVRDDSREARERDVVRPLEFVAPPLEFVVLEYQQVARVAAAKLYFVRLTKLCCEEQQRKRGLHCCGRQYARRACNCAWAAPWGKGP